VVQDPVTGKRRRSTTVGAEQFLHIFRKD